MDSVSMAEPAPPSSSSVTVEPRLKAGAIGFVSNVVISIASVAPAYSLAATLGYIAATKGLGYHAPAALWIAFFPMIAIASSYYWLNRADPDCGTTFSWVTKAMGPWAGWQAGWAVLIADVLVMPSLADVAGNYTIQLWDQIVGSHATSTLAVVIIGVIWIILMTWVCFVGIELSARLQQLLLGMEVIVLAVFAVVALLKVYLGHPTGSVHPNISWFDPTGIPLSALIDGILLAIFIYWGWDTGVSVNEETEDATDSPGKSALLSNVGLIVIYLLVTCAVQSYGGLHSLLANQADVFAPVGRGVLGSGLDWLLIIAVLSSASASTQTTILPGARTTLSMGRAKALPKEFAEIHPRFLSPGFSTIFVGALSLVVYVAFSITSHDNLIADAFTSLSLTIAFYYGITGFACTIYYRRQLLDSVKNLLLLGVIPTFGGVFLGFIMVEAIINYGHKDGGAAAPLFGIGSPVIIAIFTFAVGAILSVLQWRRERAFFRLRPELANPAVLRPGHVAPGDPALELGAGR